MISMISDAKMQLALYSFFGEEKNYFFLQIFILKLKIIDLFIQIIFFSFILITGGIPHIPLNPWGLSVTQGQDILFSSFNSGAGRC